MPKPERGLGNPQKHGWPIAFSATRRCPGDFRYGQARVFGGGRGFDESFLNFVVREVYEEIGLHLFPERFSFPGRYAGPDN